MKDIEELTANELMQFIKQKVKIHERIINTLCDNVFIYTLFLNDFNLVEYSHDKIKSTPISNLSLPALRQLATVIINTEQGDCAQHDKQLDNIRLFVGNTDQIDDLDKIARYVDERKSYLKTKAEATFDTLKSMLGNEDYCYFASKYNTEISMSFIKVEREELHYHSGMNPEEPTFLADTLDITIHTTYGDAGVSYHTKQTTYVSNVLNSYSKISSQLIEQKLNQFKSYVQSRF